MKDYTPLEGYEDLATDEDGVLEKISMELNNGTYYLSEAAAPEGYAQLADDVCFTIGADGKVTVTGNSGSYVETDSDLDAGTALQTLYIPNGKQIVPPTGVWETIGAWIALLLIAVAALGAFLFRARRQQ